MAGKGSVFLTVIATLLLSVMANPSIAEAGGPIGDVIPIFTDSIDQVHADAAYNPYRQQYLVVWHNDRPGNDDIYARRLSREGKSLSWSAISAGPGAERRYPRVAFNHARDEYLVVWEHQGSGKPNIHARRVRWDGVPLGGEMVLGTGAALANRTRPVIGYAQTSDNFLVAWERQVQGSPAKDIEVQVLTTLGALDGPSDIVATGTWSTSHEKPDLAYNRSRNEYLVVWEWLDLNTGDYDVYGRRLTAHAGFMNQPIFPIYADAGPDRSPAVAAIPTATHQGFYLIVWQSIYSAGNADIYGRRMTGQGSAIGPVLWIGPIGGNAANPAAAGSEGAREYLVAWNEVISPPVSHSAIRARTVSLDGTFTNEGRWLWWSFSDRPAVASGPLGDFLTAFQFQNPDWDIYGRLWGNRAYLPLVVRNY